MADSHHQGHVVNKLLVLVVVVLFIIAFVLGFSLFIGSVEAPEPSPEPTSTQEPVVIIITPTPVPVTVTNTPAPLPPTSTAEPALPTVAPTETPTPIIEQPDNPLHNSAWSLLNFGEGNGLIPDTNITAVFASNGLSGFAGCNNYNAAYDVAGANIAISGISSTRKTCTEVVMRQEDEYLAALENSISFVITDDGLSFDFGTGILNFGPFGTLPEYIVVDSGGESSASGKVGPGDMLTYLIPASAGQLLMVNVTSTDDTAVLSIQGNSDGVVYAHNVTAWTMAISVTQEYVIRVTTNGDEIVDYVVSGSLK